MTIEPKALCRHAAFIGGPGSGKTTAALAVIEELLLRGVPAVLIDRKGDLARYADPAAWAEPETDPDRAARRDRLRAAVDIRLYTPGSADRGRPLAIPVAPPDLGSASQADREQIAEYAAAGLCAMMDYKGKFNDPRPVILQKAIEALAAAPGAGVTVGALQKLVQDQDDALLARFDGQYDGKHFKALAADLLTLGARLDRLRSAETLDVDALLGRGAHATPGKARLAVVNTQALRDATANFWVSQLLVAVERWRAKNPSPDGSLPAVFLFDEADVYLPAQSKPATKAPLEGLLRRARSAGIGLFLATQSPGDLDYKCRDQILTWLVGRVTQKVALDKLKPLFEPKPAALDRLGGQAAGEFCVVTGRDVAPVLTTRSLIATAQLPEERVLELAAAR